MYDAIYLSPHLDDAVLSCGGQIFQQTAGGQTVLIVTIMAGDPPATELSDFAQALHARWQLANDVVSRRREEDRLACRILGADYQHGAVPDCIYRRAPATGEILYEEWPQIIAGIHPLEWALVEKLAEQFVGLTAQRRIIAPLAIGRHVDHQIVRQAAERCFGNRLYYYEDYPYAGQNGAIEEMIPAGATGWIAEQIPLSDKALQAKIAAISAYDSQLSSFFDGLTDLENQLLAYTRSVGGERVWTRKS